MIKQDLFNHRADVEQRVERERISRHDAMGFIPLNADDAAGPSMLWDHFPRLLRNVIRPEPETHLDHFLPMFGLKRGWVGICHVVLLIRGQARVYMVIPTRSSQPRCVSRDQKRQEVQTDPLPNIPVHLLTPFPFAGWLAIQGLLRRLPAQPQHRGGRLIPHDFTLVIQHRRNHMQ
jgi:hypothetical protein